MARYAKVIIDCSAEAVDRAFTYRIPEALSAEVFPGVRVLVPFGSASAPRAGYVTEITEDPGFPEERIKELLEVPKDALQAEGEMIALAAFMAREYGSTMNQALKTVLPVKRSVRKNSRRKDPVEAIRSLSEDGDRQERPETGETASEESGNRLRKELSLTKEQAAVVEDLKARFSEAQKLKAGRSRRQPSPHMEEGLRPSLLFGVTGSGKTLVYIRLIEYMQSLGKQTIVLIPEISLTYQTVRELSASFGDRVAVMHSRLSAGERYEQYEKARAGAIDVMVGPRSALFTPFSQLGLIVIDEEHEQAYHSDTSPRYDAREVARLRAKLCGGMLLLGSATPSLLSFTRAKAGEYVLYRLEKRAVEGAALPRIHLCDMRKELLSGNRTPFSGMLREMMEDRLQRGQQIMLFLNRRGYAGFVSCRSCGHVLKCPHCDVSMTAHNDWYRDRRGGKERAALLSCHYCGYRAPMPKTCPVCGSPYIAPFGMGTQKLEAAVKREFPRARVLRMDADTTARKGAHERILADFSEGRADILLGTQMIVKGHDFPKVTLVGIIAADLSLNAPEYDAGERTFQLLTQASGRAGRSRLPGDVVIQSYDPSHYAVETAAAQDYLRFYQREMSYRRLMGYPPFGEMLEVRFQSPEEAAVEACAQEAADWLSPYAREAGAELIGPCNASLYKVNDNYRKILYIKHGSHAIIIRMRDMLKAHVLGGEQARQVQLGYDLLT